MGNKLLRVCSLCQSAETSVSQVTEQFHGKALSSKDMAKKHRAVTTAVNKAHFMLLIDH